MKAPLTLRLPGTDVVVFEGEVDVPDVRPSDDLLTEAEAAEYLHVSPETLRRYRRQRRLRFTRSGNTVLYRRSWLDEFLAAHTQEPSMHDLRLRARRRS